MKPVKLQHSGIASITGKTALVLVALLFGSVDPRAQAPQPPSMGEAGKGNFLLTIFFRHDESKTLDQINAQLKAQGFYKAFPPEGVQVVSWYVMMGIGQVVTLRVPAERLRDVNRVVEQTAWGGYRTEFYATYDYKNVGEEAHAKALAQ
ncbi:MAG TPA: hypothetical protein VGV62_07575 [Xanthobacteraceae bacterium]|jgi:hypothetical protein|nr:hypothetical protein [Xanthobacteraceae bacterium]